MSQVVGSLTLIVDSIVSVVLLCKVKYPAAVLLILGTEPCTALVEM